MAIRYADFALTTGADDGTSEANAWQTMTSMLAGYAADDEVRINVKSGGGAHDISSSSWTFATNGTSTQPVIFQGWDFSAGQATLVGLDTRTNNITINADGVIFRDLSIQSTNATATIIFSASSENSSMIRCRVLNSQTDGTSNPASAVHSYYANLHQCYFRSTNNVGSVYVVRLYEVASVRNCRILATAGSCIRAESGWSGTIDGNLLTSDDPTAKITYGIILGGVSTNAESHAVVTRNTIVHNTIGLVVTTSFPLVGNTGETRPIIADNLFYDSLAYGIFINVVGLPDNLADVYHNAYGAMTSGQVFPTTMPRFSEITLTADPFTNLAGGDYSLNSAAGGGALVRQAASFPWIAYLDRLSFMDVGALQSEAAPAGKKPQTSGVQVVQTIPRGAKLRVRVQRTDGADTIDTVAGSGLSLVQA